MDYVLIKHVCFDSRHEIAENDSHFWPQLFDEFREIGPDYLRDGSV